MEGVSLKNSESRYGYLYNNQADLSVYNVSMSDFNLTQGKQDICYLCGKPKPDSWEHIYPKNISPLSEEGLFLKIKTHVSCNQELSHEESKFRDFLSVACAGKQNKSADYAYQNAMRNFKRGNKFIRNAMPSIDLSRIVKSSKNKMVVGNDGVFKYRRVLYPPNDIDYHKILSKIGRGLHALYFDIVLLQDTVIRTSFGKKIEDKFMDSVAVEGVAKDFFSFKGGPFNKEKKYGVWYVEFYQTFGSLISFSPKVLPKEPSEKQKYDDLLKVYELFFRKNEIFEK